MTRSLETDHLYQFPEKEIHLQRGMRPARRVGLRGLPILNSNSFIAVDTTEAEELLEVLGVSCFPVPNQDKDSKKLVFLTDGDHLFQNHTPREYAGIVGRIPSEETTQGYLAHQWVLKNAKLSHKKIISEARRLGFID